MFSDQLSLKVLLEQLRTHFFVGEFSYEVTPLKKLTFSTLSEYVTSVTVILNSFYGNTEYCILKHIKVFISQFLTMIFEVPISDRFPQEQFERLEHYYILG